MILLTGDLFTSPTPNPDTCLFACQKMRQLVTEEPLRHKLEYQRGKKKISPFYTLNYPENPKWESATFKVQMPVITLYGKKDRPILQPNMPTPGKDSYLEMPGFFRFRAHGGASHLGTIILFQQNESDLILFFSRFAVYLAIPNWYF